MIVTDIVPPATALPITIPPVRPSDPALFSISSESAVMVDVPVMVPSSLIGLSVVPYGSTICSRDMHCPRIDTESNVAADPISKS